MTNLIPVWKDPGRTPPDCHRSWPINIAAVTQAPMDREGHAIVPLTCSYPGPILDWRGQQIPFCILSHSVTVGAAAGIPPTKPPSPVMSDHLLTAVTSANSLYVYASKSLWSLKRKSGWFLVMRKAPSVCVVVRGAVGREWGSTHSAKCCHCERWVEEL